VNPELTQLILNARLGGKQAVRAERASNILKPERRSVRSRRHGMKWRWRKVGGLDCFIAWVRGYARFGTVMMRISRRVECPVHFSKRDTHVAQVLEQTYPDDGAKTLIAAAVEWNCLPVNAESFS
jgi:hypothetical protein